MFKVNNKKNAIGLWTYFTPCSSISIVNCEHVIAGWDTFLKRNNSIPTLRILLNTKLSLSKSYGQYSKYNPSCNIYLPRSERNPSFSMYCHQELFQILHQYKNGYAVILCNIWSTFKQTFVRLCSLFLLTHIVKISVIFNIKFILRFLWQFCELFYDQSLLSWRGSQVELCDWWNGISLKSINKENILSVLHRQPKE